MDSLVNPRAAHMLLINLLDIHERDFVTSMVFSIHLKELCLQEISSCFFLVSLFLQYSNLMAVKFSPVCLHSSQDQALIIIFVQLKAFARHRMKSPWYVLPIPFCKTLPNHCSFHGDFGRN